MKEWKIVIMGCRPGTSARTLVTDGPCSVYQRGASGLCQDGSAWHTLETNSKGSAETESKAQLRPQYNAQAYDGIAIDSLRSQQDGKLKGARRGCPARRWTTGWG